MEPYLADFINNPKIPKNLKIIIITFLFGFLVYISVYVFLISNILAGRIFSLILSIILLISYFYYLYRLIKYNKIMKEKKHEK